MVNILDKLSDDDGNVFLYYEGGWQVGESVKTVKFPYNGEDYRNYYVGNTNIVNKAIEYANQTVSKMKALSLWQRADILNKAADYFNDMIDETANILVYETGKTLKDAKGEVQRTISTLRFSADAAKNLHSETIPLDAMKGGDNKVSFSIHEPIGVVGAITGFNFPLLLAAHKLGPAFAGGNTVILKPSPGTPLTSMIMAYIFEQAGLPSGALHVINGDVEVGEAIVNHDYVTAISFTGSSKVGKAISGQAKYKKVLLELGSNAATIVDESSNIDEVIKKCITGGFSTVGQSCISVQRIIVHENIYEEFQKKLKDSVQQLRIGDPFDSNTDVPSLFTQQSKERIHDWIQEAKQQGAKVIAGGEIKDRILEPTILVNVTPNMKVFCEEIFGPVITVIPFSDFNEAISLVNKSEYGLQAGVFTNNLANAWQAIYEIQSGSVHINEVSSFRADHMPYGGVKDSGIGKEGPAYVLEELTHKKVVSFQL